MRLLVTGASGQLGAYLLQEAAASPLAVTAWSGTRTGRLFGVDLQPVDLGRRADVMAAFRTARPDLVIHAGALARVADCQRDPGQAALINTQSTSWLTELAAEAGARLLYVSTDLVFDGERGGYREEDAPSPLSIYGQSKAAAEGSVLAVPRGVVARVTLLFGPSLTSRPSFFDEQVAALREHRPVTLFRDEWRTPLSLHTAATALLALAESEITGILHLGGPERLSRLEMGDRLATYLGVKETSIRAVLREEVPAPEPRPRDTSLDSSKWRALFPGLPWPKWGEALEALLGRGKE
jgi:dTDP-4-dehydrorhamnose reductase